jgi:hypothetical protein
MDGFFGFVGFVGFVSFVCIVLLPKGMDAKTESGRSHLMLFL